MKAMNYKEYIWIEPDIDGEELVLKDVFEHGGEVSLAVNCDGEIMALKVWKEKRI